jgi:hypothetical protein
MELSETRFPRWRMTHTKTFIWHNHKHFAVFGCERREIDVECAKNATKRRSPSHSKGFVHNHELSFRSGGAQLLVGRVAVQALAVD